MKIGITQRSIEHDAYEERRDALAQDWFRWCDRELPGATMVPVPNRLSDPVRCADTLELDALILSGGADLGRAPERDDTELCLLERFVMGRRPVLGVCRGFQVINHHHGGRTSPIAGHVGVDHAVTLLGFAAKVAATATIRVNSFHANAIQTGGLAPDLEPLALAPDGSVEAAAHLELPVVGIQWHPERPHPGAGDTARIVKQFFANTLGSA